MSILVQAFTFIFENYTTIISAIISILGGCITIAMMIPGDAPEKQLQAIVNFLSKYSKK